MSSINIGSQLFINRNDDCHQIHSWVQDMASHGLHYIRLFLSWDLLERQAGQWQFEQFDAAFDAAAEHGMEIVGTLMSVSPPGWMRATQGMQDIGDLDDASFFAASMDYIDRVVSRYASHPALHSWIAWNEPSRPLAQNNPQHVGQFRSFLKEKYHTIEALNEQSFQQYENFEQILDSNQSGSALEFKSYTGDIDWLEFTTATLNKQIRNIVERCRASDQQHPIHINPHRISQCMSHCGQDIWQQAPICDFIGSSVHPAWHSVRFAKNRIQQSVAQFADMMRSATPDKNDLFWVTELQGGPTVFSAFEASGPRPQEIRQWIWESIGSGAKAVLFWCYNDRDDGFEAGEWSLLQQNGKPGKRLAAIKQSIDEIKQHHALLEHSKPHQGEIGILISSASWNLSVVEGEGEDVNNPRNQQMASDAVCGAYALAQDAGFEVRFIHEDTLNVLEAETFSCLLVPSCTALKTDSISALQRYANDGGHIIADGLCGWKDSSGSLARSQQEHIAQLFGGSVAEIYGASTETFSYGQQQSPASLFELQFDSGHALGHWRDGSPAVIKQTHQAGSATRIGTVFFQAYFMQPETTRLVLFQDLLPSQLQPPIRIEPSTSIRLRRLQHNDGELCVLMNTGAATTCSLQSHQSYTVFDEQGQELADAEISLSSHAVRLLLLKKIQQTSPLSSVGS